MTLQLDARAVLQATDERADFANHPKVQTPAGFERFSQSEFRKNASP